jgi:Flp pilus assembly protein TadD
VLGRSLPRSNRILVLGVIAALALLIAATTLLKSVHAHVRDDGVREHVRRAQTFAAAGNFEPAAAEYRAALQLRRDDPDAARGLALTVLELGQLGEAESYLRDLLRKDPTDGPLNRGLARIYAAHGRDADARTTYQRAINGEWPGDAVGARIDTRFEFVDYLTRIDAQQEVVPELLQLRAELPTGHPAAARRAAELLAARGAIDLAIETLSTTVLTTPRDVDLMAQLAELQTKTGRLPDARSTLQRAVRIERRADILERLRVVDRVLALDPTLPRLSLLSRIARARLVLEAVYDQTRGCDAAKRPPIATLLQKAVADTRHPIGSDAGRAEEELELARQIWSATADCPRTSSESQALTQVLDRVSASSEPQR